MHKRFVFILIPLLFLCSCGSPSPSEAKAPVRVGALKGATTIGMVKYIEDAAESAAFSVVTADEIVPMIVKGELDMAAIPVNLAATLYQKTGGAVRVLAINTLGLTYIVETGGEIQTVEDLRGKTVFATGKSNTPEYTLRRILREYGLDPETDLTLEFKNEPAEVVAHLKLNGGVAMLPQPFVTTAGDTVPGLREAIDLTEEWGKLDGAGTLVIGVLIARTEFLEREADVGAALDACRASVGWVTDNPAEAAPLVEKAGIAPASVAERAIPKCHLTFIEGAEMRETLSAFLKVMFDDAPESVGGALPGDDFYYVP
ncbi:MAG: PhnD/SsuA/transferrin family substrate-binding protein [Oscillospiraceae bacterium]|nr:PhnD/SsuA/transferrin family substrate-binding protein [Oscillospiraceae bacterium]